MIIDDSTPNDVLFPNDNGRGLIPRDYAKYPIGCYGSAQAFDKVDFQTIPKSEWSARIKEKEETKSRLSDLRNAGNFGQPVPSLNQGPVGYCWAHSTTHCVMLLRMVNNSPYVALSAYAVAATIKNGRDEGGWGAQSLDFITDKGVPSQGFWPQGDRNVKLGTAACWANAALHKTTEGWVDMQAAQYDRNLSFEQVATCLLLNIPVVLDYNWWGHSVCGVDLVEVESNSFGIRIWNSWGDQWEDNGTSVLRGNKAIPDGSVAPRVTSASDT